MSEAKATDTGRLAKEHRSVRRVERAEPLRRRLLLSLGEGDAVPSVLATRVDAQKESVSRKLGELRRAGLVAARTDPDDRRQSIQSLTAAGRSELGRHLAFGKPEEKIPPPDRAEEIGFLREALGGAIAMRRRSNRLPEAIERMEDIRSQALELEDFDLALEALVELTVTQRQDHQTSQRDVSLADLQALAAGSQEIEPRLVYPAVAHLEYERGKAADVGETDTAALGRHLIAAVSLFEALTEQGPSDEVARWQSRRAWSVIGFANNLREQSRYEESLSYAVSALQLFEELNDDYGRTQCWFLFGFCLRLLQRFDVAWTCLQKASALASSKGNSFERALAFCLLQMGEVRRSQSRTDEARRLLDEACERADRLDLHVARAFATSGCAAIEFQDGELEGAQQTLRRAQEIFDLAEHVEGVALNARRQATVARHLSAEGVPPREREIKRLIVRAERAYKSLGSPAGVAACEIERGWMRTISPDCGKVEPIVARLNRMLADEDQRDNLIADAWAPKVLREFSREIGGELEGEAKRLLTTANGQIKREGEKGLKSVSRVADGLEKIADEKPKKAVVEMGGEARRKRPPLELAAADA
jgi:DNA-binding MarR family transcriptional regulator